MKSKTSTKGSNRRRPSRSQSGPSLWILQSDLWLNMMAVFVTLIGGGELVRQDAIAKEKDVVQSTSDIKEAVISISQSGLIYEKIPEGTNVRLNSSLHNHKSLPVFLTKVSGADKESVRVVFKCQSTLPVKYLSECLGYINAHDNITAVIRQTKS